MSGLDTLKEIDPESLYGINPFLKFVKGQKIVEVPALTLESGLELYNFPIAYKTWGHLNEAGDNVLVICHALTGSSDVSDWWGPLLGKDLAFDPTRFFIICLNSMGSPYGSFSPLSLNSAGEPYGPEFPLCTVRDDVRAHKWVLDSLGVTSVACVIGGSMGGMLALEWVACFGEEYIENAIVLATSARNSAWCISWSEAQRQSIYSDPKYLDGYYSPENPPNVGLSAARMSALLTYRSRDSFESKFSRSTPSLANRQKIQSNDLPRYSNLRERHLAIHNDGLTVSRRTKSDDRSSASSSTHSADSDAPSISGGSITSLTSLSSPIDNGVVRPAQTYFSAQTYLRYQGAKFVKRFDANCYISITRKLDTHDLARDRPEFEEDIKQVLNSFKQPFLIIGISSDGLFTYSEQEFLSDNIPGSQLVKIDSPDGHDAFLLEFEIINRLIVDFMKEHTAIAELPSHPWSDNVDRAEGKSSIFGEAGEITNW